MPSYEMMPGGYSSMPDGFKQKIGEGAEGGLWENDPGENPRGTWGMVAERAYGILAKDSKYNDANTLRMAKDALKSPIFTAKAKKIMDDMTLRAINVEAKSPNRESADYKISKILANDLDGADEIYARRIIKELMKEIAN